MDGDDIAVLDSEIVAGNSVDAGTAVIEFFILHDDKDGVLSLLASNEDRVASE